MHAFTAKAQKKKLVDDQHGKEAVINKARTDRTNFTEYSMGLGGGRNMFCTLPRSSYLPMVSGNCKAYFSIRYNCVVAATV